MLNARNQRREDVVASHVHVHAHATTAGPTQGLQAGLQRRQGVGLRTAIPFVPSALLSLGGRQGLCRGEIGSSAKGWIVAFLAERQCQLLALLGHAMDRQLLAQFSLYLLAVFALDRLVQVFLPSADRPRPRRDAVARFGALLRTAGRSAPAGVPPAARSELLAPRD